MTFSYTTLKTLMLRNCYLIPYFLLVIPLLISQNEYAEVDAISCFNCSSRNRNDMSCEDPFNASSTSYIEKCKIPKKGRDGLFPAHFCIKVTGVRQNGSTKETLTVRKCALENMGNQCGSFKLDVHEVFDYGCILTCYDDGCNSSNITYPNQFMIFMIVLLILTFYAL